ncbi:MAG TPA: hypothetical protein ENJ95_05785 [Bacteroidetes bacterium]|nr:hypothetical protein [Bacteroidota bacterium]
MISFDINGNLFPYDVIEQEWKEFMYWFTETIEDKRHRTRLLKKYEAYVHEVKKNFGAGFHQWVDGSFITQKKKPGDIDVVTFLPYDLMVKKAIFVEKMRKTSKLKYNIDGFFAPTAKWNHRYFESCQREEKRWRDLFGTSRKGYPKGIIKLHF